MDFSRVDCRSAGHKPHSQSTLPLDGTPGTDSGTYWVDVVAATMPAPDVLVMHFAYQGQPSSTRVFSTRRDGETLTETEAFFKKDGTPTMHRLLRARRMMRHCERGRRTDCLTLCDWEEAKNLPYCYRRVWIYRTSTQ
jgi:hypothetical protein